LWGIRRLPVTECRNTVDWKESIVILSFFGIILVCLVTIALGLAALKLLAMLVKAIVCRTSSEWPAMSKPRSGVKAIPLVLATVLCTLTAIAVLRYVWAESVVPATKTRTDDSAAARSAEAEHTDAVNQALADLIANANAKESIAPAFKSIVTNLQSAETTLDRVPEKDQAATLDANKAKLRQLVSSIGQFVRASLEMVTDKQAAAIFGQAAESANGNVVVFQPSDEMVQQILGAAGQDLVKSFNSELPGRIRQTYALIPLTPPMGSTVPVQPLLAAGGLEKIANSIVSIVERTEPTSSIVAAEAENVVVAESETRMIPDWVNKTDGRRIVTHTKPILPGDDSDAALTIAINEALAEHVDAITSTMNPDLHQKAQFVRMELTQATAKKYVVDTYERLETMETATEGSKPFRVLYALLEFPEKVDQMAVRQIRNSIQQDRILGLGIVIGFAWLSVCSTGLGIRQWRRGTSLRRFTSIPVFAVIAIPALLISAGVVFAMSNGDLPGQNWNRHPVTVDLEHL
jgi:hypothetical protein